MTSDPASAVAPESAPNPAPTSQRLVSIDALRGFDMFWIVGGDAVLIAFSRLTGRPSPALVEEQLEHVVWEGFHFLDLIFPLFLFVVGVVLPFSLGKLREHGATRGALYGRIVRRAAFLFVLGLMYNGLMKFDFESLRIAGVLQRIAICYLCTALVTLNTGVRGQVLTAAGLLLGYWALLALVPAPGFKAGDFTQAGNLAGYVDRHLLPGRFCCYPEGDNEGILSTFPAVATTLLGVLAGHWLRSPRNEWLKSLGLTLAGVACLGGGLAWSRVFPIIKILWTSSYVLFAAGWSLLLLALFYTVVDVLKFRRWAYFWVVIGANAITIYFGSRVVDFEKIARFFLGGTIEHAGTLGPIIAAVGTVGCEWVVLWMLYRNKVFLRV